MRLSGKDHLCLLPSMFPPSACTSNSSLQWNLFPQPSKNNSPDWSYRECPKHIHNKKEVTDVKEDDSRTKNHHGKKEGNKLNLSRRTLM